MPLAAARPEIEELEDAPTLPQTAPHEEDWSQYAERLRGYKGSQEIEHTARHRRKSLRRHKPFRRSLAMLAAGVVFAQLCGLLYVNAQLAGATRAESDLKNQISATNEGIACTQKKISALNSSPLLFKWAADAKFRPTQLTDFDDVTDLRPLAPPQVQPVQPDATP